MLPAPAAPPRPRCRTRGELATNIALTFDTIKCKRGNRGNEGGNPKGGGKGRERAGEGKGRGRGRGKRVGQSKGKGKSKSKGKGRNQTLRVQSSKICKPLLSRCTS